jgi:hypothetical protein
MRSSSQSAVGVPTVQHSRLLECKFDAETIQYNASLSRFKYTLRASKKSVRNVLTNFTRRLLIPLIVNKIRRLIDLKQLDWLFSWHSVTRIHTCDISFRYLNSGKFFCHSAY